MKWIKELAPKFMIDFVAGVECPENGFLPACSLEYWDFQEWGNPECVVRVKVFSWLWLSVPYGMGDLYEWEDYEREFT